MEDNYIQQLVHKDAELIVPDYILGSSRWSLENSSVWESPGSQSFLYYLAEGERR